MSLISEKSQTDRMFKQWISCLSNQTEEYIRNLLLTDLNIKQSYKMVGYLQPQNLTKTPYYYSAHMIQVNELKSSNKKRNRYFRCNPIE